MFCLFHLHFHFHANEDSCTKTRFEREAKATPREFYFKDTCFPAPRLEWSWMFLYPLIFFVQYDCQLTGCLNAGSCEFIEESKVFKCRCKEAWSGSYCGGVVFIIEEGVTCGRFGGDTHMWGSLTCLKRSCIKVFKNVGYEKEIIFYSKQHKDYQNAKLSFLEMLWRTDWRDWLSHKLFSNEDLALKHLLA